ncbi:MAG: tryptophan-rich sensory protein [Clostridia bacterium]|nr:tryptophan-rich sensory protein [Clostridia bacterium]
MKITTVNLRTLLPSLLLPAAVGGVGAVLTSMGMEAYSLLKKPPLVPPGWVFAVVWTVLYLLMGYAAYRVRSSSCFEKEGAFQAYYVQLALNFLWVAVFFRFGMLWLSAVVLALLIAAILLTMKRFASCDVTASRLLIPYLVWCSFALYLNIGTAVLN